jgi:hypothetical protein
MKTQKPITAAAVLLSLAGGCDSQAGRDYKGESLLSVQGAIVASEGLSLDSDVVPVVAWYMGEQGDENEFSVMDVQDVDVSGDFPSKFELSITEFPAESVLANSKVVKGFESEPRFAFAHIGALPRKHESKIYLGLSEEGSACLPVDEQGNSTCEDQYCDYYDQCFTETTVCPTGGEDDDDDTLGCSTTSTGTTRLRNGLGVMSGFVNDYGLVYLEHEAKKGSLTAWQLGVEELEGGFHLVHLLRHEEYEEGDVDDPCVEASIELAVPRFEKAYGVSAEDLDAEGVLEDALYTYFDAAAMELGCTQERVLEFEFVDISQRITMTLGDELVLW